MNDIILIHPPSVYDFRERSIDFGPVSDLVPSTPVFEMYPIGFLSIMSNLCPEGYKIKIENIALEMILKKNFNVKKKISKLDSEIFGLDLHWLPHVHGCLNLARLLKSEFPNVPIVLGGLSASYYHNEIMKKLPFIDYIMLGDTTEPFFKDLIDSVEKGKSLENIPNLVYRDNGRIKINKIIRPENYIDSVKLDYKLLVKNCIKNLDVLSSLPYSAWLESTSAMTIIQKGCHHNCVLCGGSKFAYKKFFNRNMVTYRPVEKVIEDIISIKESLGVPVYVSGDIYQAGQKYREQFFNELKNSGIDLPFLFEIFNPCQENFYEKIEKSVSNYSMEISPESSNEFVRSSCGRYYTNFALLKNVEFAKKHNSNKFDIFFSIGLTQQKREHVNEDVEFADKTHREYGNFVHFYISPISPFIDPGSLAFEQNEKYGYKIFARTLMDHYNLLNNAKTWIDALNYETLWLTKEDIGRLSIEAGIKINEINNKKITLENGYLDPVIFSKSDLMWSNGIRINSGLSLLTNLYRMIFLRFRKIRS